MSLSSIPNIDLDDRLELAGTTNPGFTITIAVVGILKGFDALQNLVLDDVKEEGTGESHGRIGRDRSLNALADRISSNYDNDIADGRPSRTLGLVVLRGPQITLISPTDGYEGESRDHVFGSFLRNRKSVYGD